MPISLPEISKKVSTNDLANIFEKRYSEIVPIWIPLQVQWMNNVYRTYQDYEKFMIIMSLMTKTFEYYGQNFIKLDYDNFFNQSYVEIEKINIIDISKELNIPKETARRKVKELEEIGVIKRTNKKVTIERDAWPHIQPKKTITRVSRFFSTLSKILYEEKKITRLFSSSEISSTIKEYFSHVWKLYYDMQMPMLLNYKKIAGDLESYHVWGICISNQTLHSAKSDNSHMSRDYYLDKYIFRENKDMLGINAMSISDISGIPRATVIRKLNKLVKNNFLEIDKKKHYLTTGQHQDKLKIKQKTNLLNLARFGSRIYNLVAYQK